jgi:hypothetical protein
MSIPINRKTKIAILLPIFILWIIPFVLQSTGKGLVGGISSAYDWIISVGIIFIFLVIYLYSIRLIINDKYIATLILPLYEKYNWQQRMEMINNEPYGPCLRMYKENGEKYKLEKMIYLSLFLTSENKQEIDNKISEKKPGMPGLEHLVLFQVNSILESKILISLYYLILFISTIFLAGLGRNILDAQNIIQQRLAIAVFEVWVMCLGSVWGSLFYIG